MKNSHTTLQDSFIISLLEQDDDTRVAMIITILGFWWDSQKECFVHYDTYPRGFWQTTDSFMLNGRIIYLYFLLNTKKR